MKYAFPDEDEPLDPSWLEPLEIVAATIASNHRYRLFDLGDFMIMGRVVRSQRPDITLYKHHYTRRYLNLDHTGRPYRYIPPRRDSRGSGRYVVHRDLRHALDQLELWDLPWMKPGLEAKRFGLSWDERWFVHPDAIEEPPATSPRQRQTRGGRRGHLHVV